MVKSFCVFMSTRSQILIVILSFAIAFLVKKFLPVQDVSVKNVVAVVAALFVAPLFIRKVPFTDFKSFGNQGLKTLVLIISLILFVNLADLLPPLT